MQSLEQKIAGEITLANSPGASMRKWREIFGVTQTTLAGHLKITPSTISDYESNRRQSPGINVVKRFVRALVELDMRNGGWIVKKMTDRDKPDVFEVHDFSEPVNAKMLCERLEGRIITHKRKVAGTELNGYSFVDSLRAILELPVDEFSKIYGTSTSRAIVFTHVGIGRSPMVAIRVTNFKPSLVIYQGLEEMDDKIALKISEIEKIPLVLTMMEPDEIKKRLNAFTSGK